MDVEMHAIGWLLLALGCVILIGNVLTRAGMLHPRSINGMRRQRADESDVAWGAGIRALFPFAMAAGGVMATAGVILMMTGAVGWLAAGLGVAFISAVLGVVRLDRATRRAACAEKRNRSGAEAPGQESSSDTDA